METIQDSKGGKKVDWKDEQTKKVFPDRLRAIIDEKCKNERENGRFLKREEIAKSIGKARQTLPTYLDGSASPDIDTLFSIARYFNVSADWLIGLSDVKKPNADLQAICNNTGLSEEAVQSLYCYKDATSSSRLNDLVSFFVTSKEALFILESVKACIETTVSFMIDNLTNGGFPSVSDDISDHFSKEEYEKIKQYLVESHRLLIDYDDANRFRLYEISREFEDIAKNFVKVKCADILNDALNDWQKNGCMQKDKRCKECIDKISPEDVYGID